MFMDKKKHTRCEATHWYAHDSSTLHLFTVLINTPAVSCLAVTLYVFISAVGFAIRSKMTNLKGGKAFFFSKTRWKNSCVTVNKKLLGLHFIYD